MIVLQGLTYLREKTKDTVAATSSREKKMREGFFFESVSTSSSSPIEEEDLRVNVRSNIESLVENR